VRKRRRSAIQATQETPSAMSPTSSKTVLFAADPRIGATVRAPAMTKMTMIMTRQAGRRRTS
jgi:hypothetical protein